MDRINYINKVYASESDIQLFERMIGERLPAKYREFLLSKGGGALTDDYIFRMSKPGKLNNTDMLIEDSLEYFSAFNPKGNFDLNTHYHFMSSNDREFPYIPNEMIVIGGSGSSCLLLGIKGEYLGKVYFWHSNLFHGDEHGEETYDNISFVSNNFDDFLESSKIEKAV